MGGLGTTAVEVVGQVSRCAREGEVAVGLDGRFWYDGGRKGGGGAAGGPTILTVPSHELDANVSFAVWFQNTENVSLLCSW